MAKIQPITFPLGLGVADELLVLAQLHMEQQFCIVTYELRKTVENKPPNGLPVGTPFNSIILNSGKLVMTGEEYDLWGSDNTYVIQWVANKLGVVLI